MNDPLEQRLLLKATKSYVKDMNVNDIRDKHIKQAVTERAIDHTDPLKESSFLFCLSAADDLLSQWRTYGGSSSGVALGFDSSRMMDKAAGEWFVKDGFDYMLDKVEYENESELSGVVKSIHEKCKAENKNPGNLWIEFLREINKRAILIKPKGHFQEREYRLAVLKNPYAQKSHISIWGPNQYPIKSRVSVGRVIPYLEFPFPFESLVEIKFGPECKPRNREAFKLLLEYKRIAHAWEIKLTDSKHEVM